MKSFMFVGEIRGRAFITLAALLAVILGYSLRQNSRSKPTGPQNAVALATVAGLAPGAASEQAVRQLKERGLYDLLLAAIEARRARVEPLADAPASFPEAAYHASNPWRGMRAYFAPNGVQIVPQDSNQSWHWAIRLRGYGYGDALESTAISETVAQGCRVEYRRGALTEWYANDRRGFEQGFTISEPPAVASDSAHGPLVLAMSIDTDLHARLKNQGDTIEFVNDHGQTVLHYAGLKAWDATGQPLSARMELREDRLSLLVDDIAAVYPVVIDPLIFTETKLTASDKAAFDQFGFSVGISGDTVVVGAPFHGNIGVPPGIVGNKGAAYVYVRDGTTWTQQAELAASDIAVDDDFGHSVAVSGDTVVVGALGHAVAGVSQAGAAYVFVRSGTTWTQQAQLSASDKAQSDFFGESVSVSGDTVVVGAIHHHVAGVHTGAAYVFVRSGTTWTQQAQLTAADRAANDFFGESVGISGDTVVVGAALHDDAVAGNDVGATYVFVRSSTTWTQQAELTASDKAANDWFGRHVSISGDTVVAGARSHDVGAAYVFVRSGTVWTQQAELTIASGGGSVGNSVATSGDIVVIGAPFADELVGAAYVFVRSGTTWTQEVKLTASDRAQPDEFGYSVAISGDTVVVGANEKADAVAGVVVGAAYVYRPNHPPNAICQNVTKSANANCQATVTGAEVDNGSSDPDADPITFSLSPAGPYPLGTTTVMLTVDDNYGGIDTCTATVTVVDRQAPTVTCSVSQPILSNPWPPNHNLVNVGLSATATDNCSAGSVPVTVRVFGDENDEAPTGDAIFSPDAANIGSATLRLRQERNSKSNGRVYLIVATAADSAGNVGVSCCTVGVPLNMSKADLASVNAQGAAAQAYCLSHNGAAPPGYFAIGDGPIIGPKQ